jgi:hypothetical protein
MFRIGQKVASVKNAAKVGVILDIGGDNPKGIQWVKVRFKGGKGHWTLADGLREYQASKSIPVPDGVVVLVRPGKPPELFQQTGSKATQPECEAFFSAIQEMFLLHGAKTVV